MIQIDGEIYYVHGLEDQRCENDCTTQSNTDSMQSLSNYQWRFSQNYNKNFVICMETQMNIFPKRKTLTGLENKLCYRKGKEGGN